MGKKPFFSLIGLVWAGMALSLAGCGECCRNCRNKYKSEPTWPMKSAQGKDAPDLVPPAEAPTARGPGAAGKGGELTGGPGNSGPASRDVTPVSGKGASGSPGRGSEGSDLPSGPASPTRQDSLMQRDSSLPGAGVGGPPSAKRMPGDDLPGGGSASTPPPGSPLAMPSLPVRQTPMTGDSKPMTSGGADKPMTFADKPASAEKPMTGGGSEKPLPPLSSDSGSSSSSSPPPPPPPSSGQSLPGLPGDPKPLPALPGMSSPK